MKKEQYQVPMIEELDSSLLAYAQIKLSMKKALQNL